MGAGLAMLIKLEEGYDPESRTEGGQVGYVNQGRQVARGRVAPVYPRTAAQAAEVGGVVAASRAYAYDLSPEDAATYEGESCEGLNQFETWVWLWSLMQWLLQQIELTPSGGFFDACPELDDAALDPEAGSMELSVSTPSSSPNSSVRLRASRPMPAGRRPRTEDMRTLGSITSGSPQDVAPAFVGRFGSLPAMGTMTLVGFVVADPVNPAGSCECEFLIEWLEGGAVMCSAEAADTFVFGFGSVDVDLFVRGEGAGESLEWSVVVLTPGWDLVDSSPIPNGQTVRRAIVDTTGEGRTEAVRFRFESLSGPARSCEADTVPIEVIP